MISMRPAATETACRAESSAEPGGGNTLGSPVGPCRAWAVQPFGTFGLRCIPVEDHFRRWYHPGQCSGGDQQPLLPPDHFIVSAAWQPKGPGPRSGGASQLSCTKSQPTQRPVHYRIPARRKNAVWPRLRLVGLLQILNYLWVSGWSPVLLISAIFCGFPRPSA